MAFDPADRAERLYVWSNEQYQEFVDHYTYLRDQIERSSPLHGFKNLCDHWRDFSPFIESKWNRVKNGQCIVGSPDLSRRISLFEAWEPLLKLYHAIRWGEFSPLLVSPKLTRDV